MADPGLKLAHVLEHYVPVHPDSSSIPGRNPAITGMTGDFGGNWGTFYFPTELSGFEKARDFEFVFVIKSTQP